MSGKCQNAIEKHAQVNKSHPIHYQQWQSVDNRVEKVDITGTVDDCYDELKTQVGPFLLHTYVNRRQATHSGLALLILLLWTEINTLLQKFPASTLGTVADVYEVKSFIHYKQSKLKCFIMMN